MSSSGDRIRELRLKNNLTLDDVAKRLGVGRQAIYKYEQGTVTNIPLDNLEKMAAMFGTTPGYLAGWTDEREEPVSTNDDPQIHAVSTMMESMSKDQKDQILAIVRAYASTQRKD